MNGTPGNLQTTIHGIHTEECVTNPNKKLLAAKKKHVIGGGGKRCVKASFTAIDNKQASKTSICLHKRVSITRRSITPHTYIPCKQSQLSASFRTTSRTESISSAPSV
jgi:hypothetical protein